MTGWIIALGALVVAAGHLVVGDGPIDRAFLALCGLVAAAGVVVAGIEDAVRSRAVR